MSWFKVDDKLHDHRKAAIAGAEAMGLWVLAGSWCGDNIETRGFVPERVAARFVRSSRRVAAKLVTASLWEESEFEGEKGWRFHHWDEFQLTPDDQEKDRSAARERMRKIRADRKALFGRTSGELREKFADVLDPEPEPEPIPEPLHPSTTSQGVRGSRLPNDWEPTLDLIAWVRRECPDIDGKFHTEQFKDYWWGKSGRDAIKRDWIATYRKWMRSEQQQAGRRPPERAGRAGSTTDQRVAGAADLAAKYRAEEETRLEITR